MTDFAKAKELFDAHRIEEAQIVLNSLLVNEPEHLQAILLRGHIFFKKQNLGDAINYYEQVIELDPENKEAKTGLEMAKNILEYFTPDLLNP
jgi:tetratricopeptide (TPR) repeat protein